MLDEPMAGMGHDESKRMEALIQRLRAHTTVLLIEHDVDAVFRLADRVSVLVSGQIIASGAPESVRRDSGVIEAYLGEESSVALASASAAGETLLAVRGLHAGYGGSEVLQGVDLEVGAGEVVSLLGRNGMGKTTLVRTVCGLHPAQRGEVVFRGERVEAGAPHRVARRGLRAWCPRAGRSSPTSRSKST